MRIEPRERLGRGLRGRLGRRRWLEQDPAQHPVHELRGAFPPARARVRDGLADRGVRRNPIEMPELVESDLEDLAQVRRELGQGDPADRGDLGVERSLPAQNAEDELAQEVRVDRREPTRKLADERRRRPAGLQHLPESIDRARARRDRAWRVRGAGVPFHRFTASPLHRDDSAARANRPGRRAARANSGPVTGFRPSRCRRAMRRAVPPPAAATSSPASRPKVPGGASLSPGLSSASRILTRSPSRNV